MFVLPVFTKCLEPAVFPAQTSSRSFFQCESQCYFMEESSFYFFWAAIFFLPICFFSLRRLLFQSKRRRRRGILRIEDFPEEIAKNKIIFLLNEIFAHFIFLHNLVLMKENLCKGYLRRLQLSEKPWLSGKSGHLLIYRIWVQFQPFPILLVFLVTWWKEKNW